MTFVLHGESDWSLLPRLVHAEAAIVFPFTNLFFALANTFTSLLVTFTYDRIVDARGSFGASVLHLVLSLPCLLLSTTTEPTKDQRDAIETEVNRSGPGRCEPRGEEAQGEGECRYVTKFPFSLPTIQSFIGRGTASGAVSSRVGGGFACLLACLTACL